MVKPAPPPEIVDAWPPKNLVNPETRSHSAFLGITLTFTLVTCLVVSLRTWVRFFMLRAPGWDDYFIFIAALSNIALCIIMNLAFKNYGWDRHQWDQKDEWFEVSEIMQWLIQISFIILMTFSKMSALVTYLRASSRTKYNRFVWATMIVVALWGISFFFATIFECTPVHLYWTSRDGKGCSNEDARLLIATVVNIATDLIVVLMPIPLIMKLQIPMREKIILGILMSLGMLATVASVVRTVVMSQSLYTLRYDTTWNSFVVWIWLSLECNLAITCISVPVLRVLLRRILPSYWPSHGTNSKSAPGHTITTSSQNVPRDVKHASFTSLETKALKSDGDIEMYSRGPRNDSVRSFNDNGDYGLSSQTTLNTRGMEEAGEHFYQYHFRPSKGDASTVARAI